jgi:hypothetical protein
VRQQLTGSDGTIINSPAGLHDTQLNVDCVITKASDGMQRCLPITSSGYVLGYFADAACTLAVGMFPSCNPAPSYLYKNTGTCGTASYQFFSAGAAFTGSNVYYAVGTNCLLETPSAGYAYYYVGGAVAPSAFVGFN